MYQKLNDPWKVTNLTCGRSIVAPAEADDVEDGRHARVDGQGSVGRRCDEGGRPRLAYLRRGACDHDGAQWSHVQLRNVRRPTTSELSTAQRRRTEYVSAGLLGAMMK